MNKKKLFFVVLSVVLAACSVIYFYIKEKNDEEPKRGFNVSVTWSEGFSTVDEMAAAADVGITGILSDSTTEVRSGMVFTRNVVEVIAVHSGDVQVGDFIEVLQTGGAHGDLSTPAFSELPLMVPSKEYALFLKETEPHEIYGQYYIISGGYQGFAEIPDAAAQTTGNTLKFTDYFAKNFD